MQGYKNIKKIKQEQRKIWFLEELDRIEQEITPLQKEIALLKKERRDLINKQCGGLY